MLSREEILKIAGLARLDLTEQEVEAYRFRLGRVLDYVREIEKLESANDGFVRHVPRDSVAFREDRAVAFGASAALLENAPMLEENQFLLPVTVEHS